MILPYRTVRYPGTVLPFYSTGCITMYEQYGIIRYRTVQGKINRFLFFTTVPYGTVTLIIKYSSMIWSFLYGTNDLSTAAHADYTETQLIKKYSLCNRKLHRKIPAIYLWLVPPSSSTKKMGKLQNPFPPSSSRSKRNLYKSQTCQSHPLLKSSPTYPTMLPNNS